MNQPDRDKSEQLRWLGLYDNLTRLPNRYLFLDRLHHIKRHAAREKYGFAILMIALGNLKQINGEFGHDAGDRVLLILAERLQQLARNSDTVARFGGDEFTVILGDINRQQDAETIAGKYSNVIQEEITSGTDTISIDASIGISCYPNHGEDINDLLHKSEQAMLNSLQQKTPCCLYSDGVADAVADNLYNYDIDQLFRDEEIRFQYQPVCTLDTRKIVSLEALCRWNHPVMGEIYPDKLILDANNSPAMKPFVTNSLRQILIQRNDWEKQKIGLPVHFNLSAYMLNDPLTSDLIIDLLEESGLDASALVLELTETEFYSMSSTTTKVMQDLADYGIRIALDDFGVGFSSMSHLLEFPVDLIKVDKLFVRDVHSNTKCRTITASIIEMAHKLGARVVAEGVSEPQAIAILMQMGCDYAQSHAFFKPMSVQELQQQLRG
ncbi:MAG: bifunctional diguanylate cyclase/phosphodiesterase [Thiotrichales bacterium]|nr:bifunctional diguanylate cyclase/phosphodiesterase [Thiotrichales bacterium]